MLKRLLRDESGITALETAIILIAFVVVASVFAFTILSAGTASTERGEAAIYAGLEQVQGTMELLGSVKASSSGGAVDDIQFTLGSAAGGAAIDLTATPNNKMVVDYHDETQHKTNLAWTVTWLVCNEGSGSCDNLLEQDEQALISVDVLTSTSKLDNDLGTDTSFVLELKPPQGGVVPIERRTPAALSDYMDLN